MGEQQVLPAIGRAMNDTNAAARQLRVASTPAKSRRNSQISGSALGAQRLHASGTSLRLAQNSTLPAVHGQIAVAGGSRAAASPGATKRIPTKKKKDEGSGNSAMATGLVRTWLFNLGETDTFVECVLALMQARGSLLEACPNPPEVDAKLVVEFCQEAKLQTFGGLFDTIFPTWLAIKSGVLAMLTSRLRLVQWQQMRSDVIRRITLNRSTSQLFKLFTDNSFDSLVLVALWKNALVKVLEESKVNECPICLEPMVSENEIGVHQVRPSWSPAPFQIRDFKNDPCGHVCCRSCIKTWAESEINAGKTQIKCPVIGCSYKYFQQDLEHLVSSTSYERYKEYKNADHIGRLRNELSNDKGFCDILKKIAMPCPDCHVIVSKSQGCNHMACVCGAHFCFACGCTKCECGSGKRSDPWNPELPVARAVAVS